ncbi:hypothetical protein GYMLUDRAFT_46398 [Collybiopsis luxurians FD-317 M1]|uniref:F-box domain-containing protein n=1 Tax=Collybiopsis luxurians FD-317 M1 TaxID=944289 RepID=A0A0D0C3Z8_9AGAR|nr:hypothetical protein GYMLUDRAFT_46398 [Collybiopsis luxurians FD-317 M1]
MASDTVLAAEAEVAESFASKSLLGSFSNLPIEILLEILCFAGSLSQETYRALLLTSTTIHNLTRLECIPFLTILISKKNHLQPFYSWLLSDEALAHRVKYLWLAPDTSPSKIDDVPLVVVCLCSCPNLVSLACSGAELAAWDSLSSNPKSRAHITPSGGFFRHPSLKHLTVLEYDQWRPHRNSSLFAQIETLHVIGCRSRGTRFPCEGLLRRILPNLIDLSFSVPHGVTPRVDLMARGDLILSPKLKRVAFITRAKSGDSSTLSFDSSLRTLFGHRYTLFYRPKRWTEMKIWQADCFKSSCIWTLQRYEDREPRS